MRLRLPALLIVALLLAACGSVAETRPTFEPTMTSNPRLVREDKTDTTAEDTAGDQEAVAVVPTVAPTETPLPPTSTPVPTDVPTEEPTPTVVPTEVPTEIPGVEVNGLIGNPEKGYDVFHYFPNPDPNAAQKYCAACHNPDAPEIIVGPYLYGIGANHAGHDHGEGEELINYLHESIVDPNAQLAEPQLREDGSEATWSPGLMPQNWGDVLTDQQIADVIAYLLTLDQE